MKTRNLDQHQFLRQKNKREICSKRWKISRTSTVTKLTPTKEWVILIAMASVNWSDRAELLSKTKMMTTPRNSMRSYAPSKAINRVKKWTRRSNLLLAPPRNLYSKSAQWVRRSMIQDPILIRVLDRGSKRWLGPIAKRLKLSSSKKAKSHHLTLVYSTSKRLIPKSTAACIPTSPRVTIRRSWTIWRSQISILKKCSEPPCYWGKDSNKRWRISKLTMKRKIAIDFTVLNEPNFDLHFKFSD